MSFLVEHLYNLSSKRSQQLVREQYIDEMLIDHCEPCQKTLNQYFAQRRDVTRMQQQELCDTSIFKLPNVSHKQLDNVDNHLSKMEEIVGNNLNYKEEMCKELQVLVNNKKN